MLLIVLMMLLLVLISYYLMLMLNMLLLLLHMLLLFFITHEMLRHETEVEKPSWIRCLNLSIISSREENFLDEVYTGKGSEGLFGRLPKIQIQAVLDM